MKMYLHYKDSEVIWIGAIPDHWNIKRLKLVAEVRNSNVDKKTKEGEETVFLCNYVDTYKNEKITSNINFMSASASTKEVERFIIEKDDVIITKDSESPDDIAVPAFVEEDFDELVLCGYHQTLIKAYEIDGEFLFRYFQYVGTRQYFEVEAKGVTRYAISIGSIQNMPLLIPDEKEQKLIARYLDYKTSLIDRLIEINKKKIKLLEEKKRVTINEVVTKGINSDVNMKDSGVDWIGKIPEHWKVVPIKFLFEYCSGSTPLRSKQKYYLDGTIPWIKTGELNNGEITNSEEKITQSALNESSLRLLPEDSLLIAMYGQGKTRGTTGLLKIKATTNQACLAILPNKSHLIPEYLQLWFIASYQRLRRISESRSTSQPNLNAEIVMQEKIVFPDLKEQQNILIYVEDILSQIEKLKATKFQENSLLYEYRHSLISSAMTGKMDVRDEYIPE